MPNQVSRRLRFGGYSRPAYNSSMWVLKFSMARVRRTFMVAVSSP